MKINLENAFHLIDAQQRLMLFRCTSLDLLAVSPAGRGDFGKLEKLRIHQIKFIVLTNFLTRKFFRFQSLDKRFIYVTAKLKFNLLKRIEWLSIIVVIARRTGPEPGNR